jgi:predicted nucleic acid-binding protein
MVRTVVVDTGYWLALFDAKDAYYSQAKPKVRYIESLTVVFPWPILYETLGTRFVKNRLGMSNFERILKRRNVLFVNDTLYRNAAFEKTLQESQRGTRTISLCDMMLRLLLQDEKLRIDALLTFNHRDFYDVCRSAKVQIL